MYYLPKKELNRESEMLIITKTKNILVKSVQCVENILVYTFVKFSRITILVGISILIPFIYFYTLIYKIRHKIIFKLKIANRLHKRKTQRIQEQVCICACILIYFISKIFVLLN